MSCDFLSVSDELQSLKEKEEQEARVPNLIKANEIAERALRNEVKKSVEAFKLKGENSEV